MADELENAASKLIHPGTDRTHLDAINALMQQLPAYTQASRACYPLLVSRIPWLLAYIDRLTARCEAAEGKVEKCREILKRPAMFSGDIGSMSWGEKLTAVSEIMAAEER